eukprot:403350973
MEREMDAEEHLMRELQNMLPYQLQRDDTPWQVKMEFYLAMLDPSQFTLMQNKFIEGTRIVQFLRITTSHSMLSSQMPLPQFISEFRIMERLSALLKFLTQIDDSHPFAASAHGFLYELVWVLLNYSSEENESGVCQQITDPQYEILELLSHFLEISSEDIKYNIFWILSNILGERNWELSKQILNKTQLLDYLADLNNKLNGNSRMKYILPWVCCNLIHFQEYLTYEQVQVVIRALLTLTENLESEGSQKKKQSIAADIINCLIDILKYDTSHFDQIMLFDINYLLQLSLSSEKFETIRPGLKLFGQLMSMNDSQSAQIYEKFPDIHKFIVQNILTIDLNPDGSNFTEVSVEIKKRKILIKEGLWGLSNVAACPPFILEHLLQDNVAECVVKIAQNVSGRYNEIFSEAMYFLTNLVTNCTKTQIRQLLHRDVVLLLIRCLDSNYLERRLLENNLEAIGRYLEYDRNAGLQGEASIRDFFEASGGLDSLYKYFDCQIFELYSLAQDLNERYFTNNDILQDDIFSQQYQNNINIYDDQRDPPSDGDYDDQINQDIGPQQNDARYQGPGQMNMNNGFNI